MCCSQYIVLHIHMKHTVLWLQQISHERAMVEMRMVIFDPNRS